MELFRHADFDSVAVKIWDKVKIFMNRKMQYLKDILYSMKSVLIAYSGGVDSAFLLKIALDTLGNKKVAAATAESLSFPSRELNFAKEMAGNFGVKHIIIKTKEVENPKFIKNQKDRCYWCKRELFLRLSCLAKKQNLRYVADGTNFDDSKDFRPGMKAAKEFEVRSPLKEAGLGKKEIRILSKKLNLPVWDKPSLACLASRFPYGMKITKENLARVDKAENFLRKFGITQVRVRHHNKIARIEVVKEEIPILLERKVRNNIANRLKRLGYTYITVDLEGYRTGSMNPVRDAKC